MRENELTPGTRVMLPDGLTGVIVPESDYPPAFAPDCDVVLVRLDPAHQTSDTAQFVPLAAGDAAEHLRPAPVSNWWECPDCGATIGVAGPDDDEEPSFLDLCREHEESHRPRAGDSVKANDAAPGVVVRTTEDTAVVAFPSLTNPGGIVFHEHRYDTLTPDHSVATFFVRAQVGHALRVLADLIENGGDR